MFDTNSHTLTNTNFNGHFIGVVEDNLDPLKMGRCRIRVLGLHTSNKNKSAITGIPTNELPWALPVNPISNGSVSGLGDWKIPVKGSYVVLFFLNGDHSDPLYFGSIGGYPKTAPDSTKGFNDPDGIYPNILNEPDWNKYARGSTLNSLKNGNLDTFEPTADASPEYPHNNVFEAPGSGIIVEHDSTPGKERWHIYHKASKSYMEIKEDGTTIFKSVKDNYEIISGLKKLFVKTTLDEQVDGNKTSTIGGTLNITVTGKCTVKANVIELDGGTTASLDGVITGKSICHFTGTPITDKSTTVKATKT